MVRGVVVCTILVVVLALIVNVCCKETGKEWPKDKYRALKKVSHYKKLQHEKLENPRHTPHLIKPKHGVPKSHPKHLKTEKGSLENVHYRRQLENARRHHPEHYVTKERSRREDIFKPVHAFLRSLPSPLPVHKSPSSAKTAHKQSHDKYRAMKSKRVEKKKKHLKSKRFDW